MTLTGELSSTYQTTFGVHSVTVGVALDGRLAAAGPVGVASHVAYEFNLTAGSSITDTLPVNGGSLVDISTHATIPHQIEQRGTTILHGGSRSASAFTR